MWLLERKMDICTKDVSLFPVQRCDENIIKLIYSLLQLHPKLKFETQLKVTTVFFATKLSPHFPLSFGNRDTQSKFYNLSLGYICLNFKFTSFIFLIYPIFSLHFITTYNFLIPYQQHFETKQVKLYHKPLPVAI